MRKKLKDKLTVSFCWGYNWLDMLLQSSHQDLIPMILDSASTENNRITLNTKKFIEAVFQSHIHLKIKPNVKFSFCGVLHYVHHSFYIKLDEFCLLHVKHSQTNPEDNLQTLQTHAPLNNHWNCQFNCIYRCCWQCCYC